MFRNFYKKYSFTTTMRKGKYMNIDPNKVKELVLVFSKLDEGYQKTLLGHAHRLELMQSEKDRIQKENITYQTEKQLHLEVERRTHETVMEMANIIRTFKKINDTERAALIMMANQLAGKSAMQETDISIRINQKDISMQEYVEKYLMNADYNEAKNMVKDFLHDMA